MAAQNQQYEGVEHYEDYEDVEEYGEAGEGMDPWAQPPQEGGEGDDEFFSDEEPEVGSDTTAHAVEWLGADVQGISWQEMGLTRESYRQTRLEQHKAQDNPHTEVAPPLPSGRFFRFHYNTRSIQSSIVHFQLRNLVWAASPHDVYVMYHYTVNHWSPLSKKPTQVLNLTGPVQGELAPPVGRVQISTMCVRNGLLAVGGFHGELVCARLQERGLAYGDRITHDENAITNAIHIYDSLSGAPSMMASNNDATVRVFDCQTFAVTNRHHYPWPVNHTAVSPCGRLVVVVGDDPEGLVADSQTGKVVLSVRGHLDFSFASAWHPDGLLFATGNQDHTCRIWDIRRPKDPVTILRGRIGAIRSIRFTEDGRFMAMAEPQDFVHVFDTKEDFARCQEVDLFGEISGISFSPDGEALFVGIADRTYGSLLEFHRNRNNKYRSAGL